MGIKSVIPQYLKNYWHLTNAIIANLYFHSPSDHLYIIGVTGTDGKTTTSTLIYHLLHSQGTKVALISTVAAYIGDTQLDTGFHVTSPDPWQLQSLLSRIKSQGFTHVVLEVTSHGLDQYRFFGIHFNLGVITNISHEHLDYHKTMSNYIKAKSKLFTSTQTAILNQADSNYSALKKLIPSGVKIITYPQNLNSSVTQAIKTRFTQDYNQINCQAALIAVYMVLESQPDLTDAIVSFPGIPGRMEEVKNDLKIKTIVDFAHTPNSLEKVLQSLKSQTKHKLIAVFGAAGLRDHQKRPLMGKIASKLADEVILTAEDPRTEPVWSIIHQIVQGVVANHSHIHKIPDRQQAINFALKLAKPGDTVVVLGKGHEKSMCFGKIEHSWSDQEALNKAIRLKHAKN